MPLFACHRECPQFARTNVRQRSAQLAEEDRASRRTVPDVPSGPLLEIIESLSLPQSQVETMPLALPARVKAPAPTDGNPMVILLAAAVVTLFALGILAFFAR